MPFLPALVPMIAGFAIPELSSAVGLTGLLTGATGIGASAIGLGEGALSGALAGGLTQHSGLGALEGALGGFGGAGIASAIGTLPDVFGGASAVAPLGATGAQVLNPALLTTPGVGGAVPEIAGMGDVFGSGALSTGTVLNPSILTAGAPNASAASGFSPVLGESGFATLPGGTAPSFFAPAAGGTALGAGLGGLSPGAVANLASGAPGALGLQSGAPTLASPVGGPGPTGVQENTETPAPSTGTPEQPTTSAPAAVGSGGGSPTSSEGLLGSALGFLNKNPALLQLALGAGGLGASALERPTIPGLGQNVTGGALNPQSSLGQEVATNQQFAPVVPAAIQTSQGLTAGAQPLINAPTTGQLPPGMQQMITQQLQDEVTAIKSKYASLGEPGSTAETQDIAAAGERAQSATANLLLQTQAAGLQQLSSANSAVNEALNAAGLQNQVWSQIAGIQLSSDQELQQAISNISSAAAGGVGRAA